MKNMTKAVLKKLGMMRELKQTLHNEWVTQGYTKELRMKWELVNKVFKCLEEVSRGKIKSKIPYPLMADFLIENARKLSYQALHHEVMEMVLKR